MLRSLATTVLISTVALVYGRPSPKRGRHTPVKLYSPGRHRAEPAPNAIPEPESVETTAPRGLPVLVEVTNLPTTAEIEAAARLLGEARTATNTGSRLKRAAEKVLSRTPNGTYGAVVIGRKASTRKVADLDAIAEIFVAHGLGPVPMKTCAPSLTTTWAAEMAA